MGNLLLAFEIFWPYFMRAIAWMKDFSPRPHPNDSNALAKVRRVFETGKKRKKK